MDELKKALVSGDVPVLVLEDLEAYLYEELLKLQPLFSLLAVEQAVGKTHEYNVRTSHPLGWFEGELTPGNNKQSTYARKTVMLKIARMWGEVSGFAQKVTEQFLNMLETEIVGILEGFSNLFEYGVMFGCSDEGSFTGDAYQVMGILPTVYQYAPENVIDAGGAVVDLPALDSLIAKVTKWRGTKTDPRLFLMSLEMKQKVDGLQTKVSIPLTSMQLADGKITMAAYAGTPIYETDYTKPLVVSPDASASASASAGVIPAGDYAYRISAVHIFGEQFGGAASSAVTLASNGAIDVSWTADSDAVSYMIFRQDGSGEDFCLIDIIPALTYDSDGSPNGVVEAYTDDGSKSPITQVRPLATDEEMILLVNTNPKRGVAVLGLIDDMGQPVNNLIRFVELARTKDSYAFFLKAYWSVYSKYSNVHAVLRNVKRA